MRPNPADPEEDEPFRAADQARGVPGAALWQLLQTAVYEGIMSL